MKKTKEVLIALAEYYGHSLSENQLRMYADDLVILSDEQLSFSIKRVRLDTKITKMPLPAVLIYLATGESSNDDDKARTIAAQILTAISRFGWNNQDAAKECLGEGIWSVVDMQGGWVKLCSLVNEDNFTSMQAQLRDISRAMIRGNFKPQPQQLLKLDPKTMLSNLS